MERTLGLMCGAGSLPARMAGEARRQGWRVVAFAFPGAPAAVSEATVTIPSQLGKLGPVMDQLAREKATGVLFAGHFSMRDVVRADVAEVDAFSRALHERAGSRVDRELVGAIISALAAVGIEVLDQRGFLGTDLSAAGCWSARRPTEAERAMVRRGLEVARLVAAQAIGQTVVVRHGVVTAVEAVEGTTEAIRRGTALAGAGAVVVKTAAPDHDYRFDVPTVGPETVQAAGAGGAAVLAVEAGRVLIVDRADSARAADAAGMALVSVDDDA